MDDKKPKYKYLLCRYCNVYFLDDALFWCTRCGNELIEKVLNGMPVLGEEGNKEND